MPSSATPSNALAKAILITGFIAGTMDITGACISAYLTAGLSPFFVLQYVASGLLGKESFSGGIPTAALGLLIHYVIAYSWTLLFFLAYPKLSFLSANKIVIGILYGAFVWVMMNQVILRIAGMVPPASFNVVRAATAMVILMICIGLPISIGAHKFYSRQ